MDAVNAHCIRLTEIQAKLEEEDELQDDIDEEPELDAIDIGGQLPTLTLKNEKNEDVEIGKIADDQGVVLFLVPKADTRESSPSDSPRSCSPSCQRDARAKPVASQTLMRRLKSSSMASTRSRQILLPLRQNGSQR